MHTHWKAAGCLAVALSFALSGSAAVTPEQRDYFESHIRPVLAQQCFICHTNSGMGGLRLDSRERMLAGGDSGKPVIVPGAPDNSLLITAIKQTTELKMPKRGTRLTDDQIDRFVEWVAEGAYWPEDFNPTGLPGELYQITEEQRKFWSFQPLAEQKPPVVKNAAWPLTNIDRFVLAKLESMGLEPAPAADARTLIRRLYYDLTGLPPTYEEVQAFAADPSPRAYEALVDKLLASPRHGEKWGRHWLDVVRYAEDDYNVSAKPDRAEHYPNAYTYRDWVIKALNDDMPFDNFVKAQLAADQMDDSVRKEMIGGLGMNGLGVWQFTAGPPPIMRADEWHDKVDATTKAFLGLTVGCARCHDHKYDPIPTKDYYRLAGVFASSEYHAYPLVDEEKAKKYDEAKKKLKEMEEDLEKFEEDVSAQYSKILFSQTERYMMAAFRLATEKHAAADLVAAEEKLDAEVLERWERFLKKKPYNYTYLADWQKMIDSKGTKDDAEDLAAKFYAAASKVVKLYDDIAKENEFALLTAKGGEDEQNLEKMPNGKDRKLNPYQIDLKGLEREQSYLWTDMFKKDLADYQGNPTADPEKRPGLLKFEGFALEKRVGAEWLSYLQAKRAEIEAFKKEMGDEYPYVYGLADAGKPLDLSVFLRGDPYTFGEEAPRAFLKIFAGPGEEPKPFSKGSGRLELAEAILEQPITARVIANRIWRWHMGVGLVETPSNFGGVGERPTNPELLDYLASEFLASGGSWKTLHKQIVMSRAYQLGASEAATNLAKDADNRYYWRSNRRRLRAEGIWDSMLVASGKLDLGEMGGKSFQFGTGVVRRAVYGNVSRTYMSDFQETFDVPVPTLSAERRYTTNVPQQRLFFLNDPWVKEQVAGLVKRVREASAEPRDQIQAAYRIAYQREATKAEIAAGLELLGNPLTFAPVETASAGALMGKPAPRTDAAMTEPKAEEPAAKEAGDDPLATLCWALLASNELLYVE
jgi:hypothetical protein